MYRTASLASLTTWNFITVQSNCWMLIVNEHCTIFTNKPLLSKHLLLTGHLGRSRSCPLNRGFSIEAQTSATDSNDIILSQIIETSYLDISNTRHWKSGGCWQRLNSRTLEHSSKTDPCSKDTQRTQTKKINLVNDSFTSDKNLLY